MTTAEQEGERDRERCINIDGGGGDDDDDSR